MNKLFTIVTMTIIVSSLAFGYEASKQADVSKLVGVWKSIEDVNGEPQAVITINKTGKQVDGKFVFRGLTVNERDNITIDVPLTNISFDGSTFSFKVAFPGPERMVVDWELILRNENEAGLGLTKEDGKPVENAPSFVMKRAKSN